VATFISVGIEINHLGSFKEEKYTIRKKKTCPIILNNKNMFFKVNFLVPVQAQRA